MHTASTSFASTTSRQSPWARPMPNSLATRSLDSLVRLATDTSSIPAWALSLGIGCFWVLPPAPTNPTRIGLSVMGRHGNTVGTILPGRTADIMDTCCEVRPVPAAQRAVLQATLWLNAVMFLIECGAGVAANSTALLADSVDMLGDAIVYGFSLYAVGRGMVWQSRSAFLKGLGMAGLWRGVTLPGA